MYSKRTNFVVRLCFFISLVASSLTSTNTLAYYKIRTLQTCNGFIVQALKPQSDDRGLHYKTQKSVIYRKMTNYIVSQYILAQTNTFAWPNKNTAYDVVCKLQIRNVLQQRPHRPFTTGLQLVHTCEQTFQRNSKLGTSLTYCPTKLMPISLKTDFTAQTNVCR